MTSESSETSETSDIDLLLAWRGGDDGAGEALVQRHFERVFLFFDTKVNEGVEDLVQRTFLGCVEARDRLGEDANFRAYLLGIARKQLLKYFARVRRRNALDELAAMPLETLQGSPSRVVAKREEHRLLVRALRTLPLDLQIALELFYWEEMPIAGIATVLEIPPGTVKSRLFRAKDLVKQRILAMEASRDVQKSTVDDLDRWARSLRDVLAEKE